MKIEREAMKAEGGAAYVEFLLAFLPLFFLFLGMVQMCLMYSGDLVVQHAASRASRAAAVVLDDDPQRYGGEARRRVDGESSSSSGALGALVGLFAGGGGGGGGGSSRLGAIRTAASMPLASISPSARQFGSLSTESIRQAIDSPESRAVTGVFMYNDLAMEVTFPSGPGSDSTRTSWSHGDQVTTRVTYSFHCGIPLVNRMMCRDAGPFGIGGFGQFFKTLQGEATMPLMSARYEY